METVEPEVPENPTSTRVSRPRPTRRPNRWYFSAAGWGALFALRSIGLTVVFTVLVIAPDVIAPDVIAPELTADPSAAFGAQALFDSTVWGWLLLNGAPPRLGAATLTLLPWGLVLLPWCVNFFGARSLMRRYRSDKRLVVVSNSLLFVTYASVVVLSAVLVRSMNVSYSAWAALTAVVALTASAIVAGSLSETHSSIAIPKILRFIVARGAAAALALFGLGALIVAILLLANFSDVLFLFNQLNPGLSGFLALTILSIGYLPVLAVWAVAYFTGAGFTIGPEVTVSPFIPVTAPTQLPPFPPLVVLPEAAGAVSWLLPALVITIGVVWGIGVSVHMARETLLIRLVIAVGISAVAAVIIVVLGAISVGNLGDVRLTNIGPDSALLGSLTWLLLVIGMIPASIIPAGIFNRERTASITVVKPDD